MSSDIRIQNGFPDHPKVEKLVRLTDERAVRCLLRLWAWAAENRHKGVLHGMDSADVAIVSKWSGQDAEWIAACIRAGLLDGSGSHDDPWRLHDWEEHQPFVFYRDKRVAQAKKAAAVKWNKRYGSDADSNAGSNADSNAPPPTPTPSPTPSPKGGRGAGAANGQKAAAPTGEERRWRGRRIVRDGDGRVSIEITPGTWCSVIQFDSSLSSQDVWEDAQP